RRFPPSSPSTTRARTMASKASNDGDAEPGSAIYAVSCAYCERIVGDSGAWVCSTRELAAHTFERLTSIVVSESIQTVRGGEWDEYRYSLSGHKRFPDICSVYRNVDCEKCSATL